ncbi:heavy metal translocating P-type ATPase [Solicola sp. PLA-1-18]|uniref:heavy metal translocating P-type ATPase n=1 Tax=Solicola sp. PLA-1-18 TaxID=3380532 RepID=UPI003B811939
MSDACCGSDDDLTGSTSCCGPGESCDDHDADHHEEYTPWFQDRGLALPALSGVFLVLGYALELTAGDAAANGAWVLGILAGGWTFVPSTLRRLRRGKIGVSLLMTIALVGAIALARVGEAAALTFLFSIAEALEDRAMDRAKHGLKALLSLIPDTARVSQLGCDVVVKTADVRVGDILVIGAGERVATDGEIVTGRSSIDTSAVTGESIPVEVGPADQVPAGSINGTGTIRVQAVAAGRDNSLTTIVRLVQEAQARKGDRARLADRIARPLVPAVLIVSALIVAFGFAVGEPGLWLERALVVLVAASPCALAIAVPVTVISSIGAASKFGVVIKSGEAFEQLGGIGRVAFDKTGTLTRNKPEVVDVRTTAGFARDEVLLLAASLEASSTHPLAAAFLAQVPAPRDADDVHEEPGRGLSGSVAGRQVRVGSPRWLPVDALDDDVATMTSQGMSIAAVEVDGHLAGVVGIRDELKPEASAAVAQLHADGIETVMLTGDNSRTAHALAAEVGITDVRAEQMPGDKSAAIEALSRTRPTAMVGDGINDAPALAAATVGIAMGATGTAAAVESADVAFTGNDLRLIPQALAHARRGRRIMTGNIVLALLIIVVLFPLALFGVLGLAGVVLVHEVAEVVVILNGLRAARAPRRELAPIRSATITPPRQSVSA